MKNLKSALAKIKAAKLTIAEANAIANYFAQCVAVHVGIGRLSDEDFFTAQEDIVKTILTGTKS